MPGECDVAVIGAGVVGLAAAAALARAGRSVIALERHAGLARETTSRNSQVIHAGIYYPAGSEKAVRCVAGRQLLYERCQRLGIPHRKTGKWIVAVDDAERAQLETLLRRGRDNGVPGLHIRDGEWLQRLEPHVRARAALVSPESGIVDANALSLSFAAEAEAYGASIALRHEVVGLASTARGWRVETLDPERRPVALTCAAVVNAAGLAADRVAALAGVDVEAQGYRLHLCKGDYFALAPGAPLRVGRLVYPVPAGAGLGIHATLDLGGRIRFGPDAEYVDRIDYDVAPEKAVRFAAVAGRYLPGLRAEWLTPDGAGIRPRLAGPGTEFRDFVVREESALGRPGLVDLIGIESPGLTAAPAIGARVVELLAAL